MTRTVPPHRFAELVRAATMTFIARGYRMTQMADVAEALGVAKGTLYGYVESKEALFDAAVRFADGHVTLPSTSELPLRTPAPGATVAYVKERLAADSRDLVLARVASGELVIRDVEKELAAVFSDLYRRIAKNRLAMKLVDRSATDYPELAVAWFGKARWAQHRLLVDLLTSRATRRGVRRLDQPEIIARAVLETLAFWAMHRHFDPAPQPLDEEATERAVIGWLVNGLLEAR